MFADFGSQQTTLQAVTVNLSLGVATTVCPLYLPKAFLMSPAIFCNVRVQRRRLFITMGVVNAHNLLWTLLLRETMCLPLKSGWNQTTLLYKKQGLPPTALLPVAWCHQLTLPSSS